MRPRTYTVLMLACAAAVAAAPTSVNLQVDPYALWHATVDASGYRPNAIILDERTAKILRARRDGAEILLLGTSRTAVGIDPHAPQFRGRRAYNLGFGGQSLRESRLLLEAAAAELGVKDVYLGLDFFAANAHFTGKEGLTSRLVAAPVASALAESAVSWHTLRHSHDILAGRQAESAQREARYDSGSGALRWSAEYVRANGGHRKMFAASELAYATDNYRPAPARAFALEAPALKRSAQREFSLLVRAAQRHGIRLHLFISPSHARQWTTLDALGLWPQFESWKRMLARTLEDEAQAAGRAPFALWDFADYPALALEPLPDGEKIMQGYWDSSHYRPEVGTQVLARIHGEAGADPAFGARLESKTIDAHLMLVRARRDAYERHNAADVEDIRAMARRVLGAERKDAP